MDAILADILDLARWAPSGDNTQPWRFEVLGSRLLRVHGFDTRDHCVYDLDGHPSHLAHGALLETLAIAATTYGLRATTQRLGGFAEERPCWEVTLEEAPRLTPDPLAAFIKTRSVQRRPLSTHPLSPEQKATLQAAVGPTYQVQWKESFAERLAMARLLFANSKIRLTIPEAYQVHKAVIQWNARFSEDKIPDQALGADALTRKLMAFVLRSWPRVEFFNTWLAGTWGPRFQLDFIPALACGAHFLIVAPAQPQRVDDWVAAGRVVQRFWLAATSLDLKVQPAHTPLVFAAYARAGQTFSNKSGTMGQALAIRQRLIQLWGQAAEGSIFMGRVGRGAQPMSRSTRMPLEKLTHVAPTSPFTREESSP